MTILSIKNRIIINIISKINKKYVIKYLITILIFIIIMLLFIGIINIIVWEIIDYIILNYVKLHVHSKIYKLLLWHPPKYYNNNVINNYTNIKYISNNRDIINILNNKNIQCIAWRSQKSLFLPSFIMNPKRDLYCNETASYINSGYCEYYDPINNIIYRLLHIDR